MKKLELFKKGLKSPTAQKLGLKVETNWTGITTFKFPAKPDVTFRIDENAKLNKDGSLNVAWIDLSGLTVKSGMEIIPSKFIETMINTVA